MTMEREVRRFQRFGDKAVKQTVGRLTGKVLRKIAKKQVFVPHRLVLLKLVYILVSSYAPGKLNLLSTCST